MLGFSLVVVDEWMTRIFGSFLLAGAITWLNNARRMMQVPVGVFGQASGVAFYPFLSAQAARGEREAMWKTLSATLRWVFFVSCAAAAIFGVLSREIVLAVFKRGAFTIDDTLSTASALAAFSIGIPFWCAQSITSRGFFALKDTWTPTLVGTGAWLISLPAYYLLTQKMGVFGLALASSIGIFLHATGLYGILMVKPWEERRPGVSSSTARSLFGRGGRLRRMVLAGDLIAGSPGKRWRGRSSGSRSGSVHRRRLFLARCFSAAGRQGTSGGAATSSIRPVPPTPKPLPGLRARIYRDPRRHPPS